MSTPTQEAHNNSEGDIVNDAEHTEHDPHYEPIISLPVVEVPTMEEDEEELCKIRAKLYRYDTGDHEWKERGTGDIKLLRHKENNSVRVVMRREKTLKLCANHFITPDIRMNVHCGSDKAFNWSVFADFADETAKQELLAIRFGNAQNAELWKTKFCEAQEIVRTKCSLYASSTPSDEESSFSNSEETETPEPSSLTKDEEKDTKKEKKDSKNVKPEDILLKLQDLKVEEKSGKSEPT